MPSIDLAMARQQWITEICTGMVAAIGDHATLDSTTISPKLGKPDLVRAALVARTSVLLAKGHAVTEITEKLVASDIFTIPGPGIRQVTDLVKSVDRRLRQGGVTDGIGLSRSGLRSWHPEATYQFLLELWSAQRRTSASTTQIKRELARHWDVRDPDQVAACLAHRPDSLNAYPDLYDTLRAASDPRAGSYAALAVSRGLRDKQNRQQREDRLPATTANVEHLIVIDSDLVTATEAKHFLEGQRLLAPPELRPIVPHALAILDDHLARLTAAVNELTALERDLLRERGDEERFQDGCLAAWVAWSRLAWSVTSRGFFADEPGTDHGLRGCLPWWTITVHGDDGHRVAAATVAEGALPLSFYRDPESPDLLTLLCRRPRTGAPGLRASFVFDLTDPAHASELLLVGRRGSVCVDVCALTDEPYGLDRVLVGTVRVTASKELALLLVEMASGALKRLLPDRRTMATDEEQTFALRELLDQGANSSGYAPGRIDLETVDPPTTASQFTTVPQRTKRPTAKSPQEPVRTRHDLGFVYVQRNAAISGMVKIGFSRRLPEDRAEELSNTSVPFPFEVLFRVPTCRARDVEQAVHQMLGAHRVAANREFFRIDQSLAEQVIRDCQERITGIGSWQQMPVVHRLRSGDRLALPLRAGQVFVTLALPDLLAPSATVVDVWQAHADGDVLELHVVGDPGQVRGLSDLDSDAYEDPVPFLDRAGTAPNGHLIGRERLTAGDRLVWLSDHDAAGRCVGVVFELQDSCQVICRSWQPQLGVGGMPILLNDLTREPSRTMVTAVQEVLALGPPRTWAPRNPDPTSGWRLPATRSTTPQDWLPQLGPRRRSR